jgi:hypothetical protein
MGLIPILLIIVFSIYKIIRWDSVVIEGRKYHINIFGNKSF